MNQHNIGFARLQVKILHIIYSSSEYNLSSSSVVNSTLSVSRIIDNITLNLSIVCGTLDGWLDFAKQRRQKKKLKFVLQ